MPGEYTMLVRSLVTIEGVLEALCPALNLFDFLSQKMIERMRENFDAQEKIAELLQTLTAVGTRTAKIPSMVFDVLRNLVKGRMKINLELTGYEEIFHILNGTILNVVLAVFACVLFTGSCILCTTNIEPQAGGMPLMSLIGFVVSVALAIYSVQSMSKRK